MYLFKFFITNIKYNNWVLLHKELFIISYNKYKNFWNNFFEVLCRVRLYPKTRKITIKPHFFDSNFFFFQNNFYKQKNKNKILVYIYLNNLIKNFSSY